MLASAFLWISGTKKESTPHTSSMILAIQKVASQWLSSKSPLIFVPKTLPIRPNMSEMLTAIAL